MNENIEYLKTLLIEKEKQVDSFEDIEKVENLKSILKNDNVFFNISMETAVGIFEFLGVPKSDMIDLYFNLISPKSYQNLPNDYITISKEK